MSPSFSKMHIENLECAVIWLKAQAKTIQDMGEENKQLRDIRRRLLVDIEHLREENKLLKQTRANIKRLREIKCLSQLLVDIPDVPLIEGYEHLSAERQAKKDRAIERLRVKLKTPEIEKEKENYSMEKESDKLEELEKKK